MRIEGEAAYIDKSGKRHRIDGCGKLSDSDYLQSLSVDGTLSFGKISCNKFKLSGDCSGESLTAEEITIDGDARIDVVKAVKFRFSGDCSGNLLTAEKITIDGDVRLDVIKAVKVVEISGDMRIDSVESNKVAIESRSGRIDEIKCSELKIFDNYSDFEGEISFGNIRIKTSRQKIFSQVQIKNIAAEKVELKNCKVSLIKCKDAIIGENCAIEKLIVSGKFELDENSKVNEVIKQ